MAQNTFALMTNLGRAKEAAAIANGTAVVVTHIAIGDGVTVPSGGETALYNEIARKAISGHGTVVGASNVAYFDIFLEAAEGPYTIREAGLIDQDGDLIAIARYDPPISKPIPSSGQTVEGTIRLEIAFSNIAAITIVVDPSFKVALQRINRLPWLPIVSMTTAAPPASPALGDAYVVPVGATGAWVGQSGKIAEYTSAGWAIITPANGHGVSLPDGRIFEKIGGVYVEKIALDVQSGKWRYAVAAGSATALTVALDPVPTDYRVGMQINMRVPHACQGATTLSVNGMAAKQIVRSSDFVAPIKDDWRAGAILNIVYDGERFQLIDANYSLSPLNRIITPPSASINLTPADAGGMFFSRPEGPVVYNLPKPSEFGVNYIGFLRNVAPSITVNVASEDGGRIQFSNEPTTSTVVLNKQKAWLILLCDGNNWLVFSAHPMFDAGLGLTLSSGIYREVLDNGKLHIWGSVVRTPSSELTTINLPVSFSNADYRVVLTNGDTFSSQTSLGIQSRSTSSFQVRSIGSSSPVRIDFDCLGDPA
ncbi:phage tail protein [Brucella pecoris]|nr:phage tail protein [Brucella pecoris]MBB4092615.1 hypothetical protein [Brucella pecoris]